MEQAYCEALKTAIEFELNGLAFYRQLIDRVSDPFAKRVLVFLAGEEVGHIRKIEAFNNFLLGKGDFDMEEECNLDLPDKIQALVQEKMKEAKKNVTPESDDLDIYDVAMLLESKSRELYEQALDENKDESVEIFLRFMLSEENEHYDLLFASKRYLEDPAYYFEEYGGWIFG
ncbi:MAG: ferritin family protein [Actinomycetota bacterium]|nr:ferritin family protein [Actinomycetota bacterium]